MGERHITRQLLVRIYGTPLDEIKPIMRKIAAMQGVKPALLGLDNEYIVAINVESGGFAAATSLCEAAAGMIEAALGDDVYGRGDRTLAHCTATTLVAFSAQLCAASLELGEAFEEEFKTTKRATHIYDFGEFSYRSTKKKPLTLSRKVAKHGEASLEAAAELAKKASARSKVRFGCAIAPLNSQGKRWIAVSDNGKAYAKQMEAGESTRACALALLDLVRRLANEPIMESKIAPVRQKALNIVNRFAVIAAAISIVFSLLTAGGLYYLYDKFYIPNQPTDAAMRSFK